jgi:hypothetical protein
VVEVITLFRLNIELLADSFEEEMFIESNYQAILAEISRLPLEKAEIRLGERVIEVESMDRETPSGKMMVKIEKGEKLFFDEVIMTTPLGWLKRNQNVFTPPLPTRILAGIDAVSVGHLEKVGSRLKILLI